MTALSLAAPQTGGALALFDVPALVPTRRPALSKHAPSVYLASLSKGSQRVMRFNLEKIAALLTNGRADFWTLPWPLLRYEHTAAIRARLADIYAPAKARQMLCALRGTLKAAWKLDQMDTDAYMRAIALEPIKGKTLPAGRALTPGEVMALFGACGADPGIIGARDAALLAVLLGAGLRRGEAVALKLADYNAETGDLLVRRGKGRKDRLTFLGHSAREAVNYWIEFRGQKEGPLLHPLTRTGRILRRQMHDQGVMVIVLRRAAQAHIKRFSPHDCRKTCISNLFAQGVDIATIQKMMGHESPETTANYDRRLDAVMQRAAEGIHIPFFRPHRASGQG